MRQSILLLCFSLLLTMSGMGQRHKPKALEVPIISVGTLKWPFKLTKQRSGNDTLYNLTFHDAGSSDSDKMSTQGFFIFDLTALAEALQTALSTDSGSVIHFQDGRAEKTGSEPRFKSILVNFTTGGGSFIVTAIDTRQLINPITHELRLRNIM